MRILHSKKLVFISKPRCGSTSLRRILDSQMKDGDEKSDVAGDHSSLHPHTTGPAIYHYLKNNGYDVDNYTFFTVTRNPLNMLQSYYNFFQPDTEFNYNYSPNYNGIRIGFEEWVSRGKVGIGNGWKPFLPNYVTSDDLSPLSLDAHVKDSQGNIVCDHIFKMEERESIVKWLSSFLDVNVLDVHVNSSIPEVTKEVKSEVLAKLESQFLMDFKLYGMSGRDS